MILGRSPNDQPRAGRIDGQLGVGNHRLERFDQLFALVARDRVDLDLGPFLDRRFTLQLLDDPRDLLVLAAGGMGDDALGLRVAGELHLGKHLLEEFQGRGHVGPIERIDRHLLFDVDRRARVHLLDRLANRLLILGRGPNGDPPRPFVHHGLHLGKQLRQHVGHTLRIGRLELVTDELELPLGRERLLYSLEGRLDYLVIGRRGHDHQPLAVLGHLGSGGQLLQGGQQAGRRGLLQRIKLQDRRIRPRLGRLKLFQYAADRLLLSRTGPDQQPIGLRIELDLRVGEERLQRGQHGCRVGYRDRIGGQGVFLFRRYVAIKLFEDPADRFVLRGQGPNGQFTRLGVGDHLDAGQLGRDVGQDGLEPFSLGRRHRIDGQAVLLARRGRGFHLVDDRLDNRLIDRRGQYGHVSVVFL